MDDDRGCVWFKYAISSLANHGAYYKLQTKFFLLESMTQKKKKERKKENGPLN